MYQVILNKFTILNSLSFYTLLVRKSKVLLTKIFVKVLKFAISSIVKLTMLFHYHRYRYYSNTQYSKCLGRKYTRCMCNHINSTS